MSSLIPTINYTRINDALCFYTQHGFAYKETPWIVSFGAYSATRPPTRPDFYTLGGYLVASGEQGFIEELLSGKRLTKHVTVTPCFREEECLDEIHYRYFMKVELIDMNASIKNLKDMISLATHFFSKERRVEVIQTDTRGEMFDIIDSVTGIELGSYGIRTVKNIRFIYGTGLAEPRYSVVTTK